MTKVEQELDEMRHEAAELLASSRELQIRSAEFAAKAYALDGAVDRISIALREDAKGEEDAAQAETMPLPCDEPLQSVPYQARRGIKP